MGSVIDLAFKLYQRIISPLLHFVLGPGQGCRFEPTCSRYTQEALREYGFLKGMAMGLWRILRCNPFSRGGYDPVRLKK